MQSSKKINSNDKYQKLRTFNVVLVALEIPVKTILTKVNSGGVLSHKNDIIYTNEMMNIYINGIEESVKVNYWGTTNGSILPTENAIVILIFDFNDTKSILLANEYLHLNPQIHNRLILIGSRDFVHFDREDLADLKKFVAKSDIKIPFFLIHGGKDSFVKAAFYSGITQIVRRLSELGPDDQPQHNNKTYHKLLGKLGYAMQDVKQEKKESITKENTQLKERIAVLEHRIEVLEHASYSPPRHSCKIL